MSGIDRDLVSQEWPREDRDGIYFNNGSCSVKPRTVMQAVQDGWVRQNRNPTLLTFLDHEPLSQARQSAAALFQVESNNLLLIQNSTYGLQMVLQSFLLKPGDELVTTNHEHGCVNTIGRYLQENRGIIVRQADMNPLAGSTALTDSVLALVNARTKLVAVSEIDCHTGWRPDLDKIGVELKSAAVPFLVDGAHVPGQGPCFPGRFAIWVASGHKWLGGPNSTGFLHICPEYAERLIPLCLGDRFFWSDLDGSLARFEWQGTSDATRWSGLEAALRLQGQLEPTKIAARQLELVGYLRNALSELSPQCQFRTTDNTAHWSGMVTAYWSEDQVCVADLRETLWQTARIWTQPDSISSAPGLGMRLSCPVYIDESDVDALINALAPLLRSAASR